jgi:prepilin-type N-terminal cleavage/methylation domain-containing protein
MNPAPARAQRGFTLLELSIVLSLIAVILSGALAVFVTSVQASQFNATVAKMDTIEKALLNYGIAKGRIPCPSDLTLTPATGTTGTYYNTTAGADYGMEAGSDAKSAIGVGTGICTGTNMTPQANFAAASGAAEGGVPTRALQLPDDYMYDGWGRRFRYTVDPVYTKTSALPASVSSQCSATSVSAITVLDAGGGNRTTGGMYALISHGANGHGAYTSNGVVVNTGSTSANELTNCHCTSAGVYNSPYTPTYIEKAPGYDAGQTGVATYYFDDIVTFKEPWQLQAQNFPLSQTPAYCLLRGGLCQRPH